MTVPRFYETHDESQVVGPVLADGDSRKFSALPAVNRGLKQSS
jgi:hypothetical protein